MLTATFASMQEIRLQLSLDVSIWKYFMWHFLLDQLQAENETCATCVTLHKHFKAEIIAALVMHVILPKSFSRLLSSLEFCRAEMLIHEFEYEREQEHTGRCLSESYETSCDVSGPRNVRLLFSVSILSCVCDFLGDN